MRRSTITTSGSQRSNGGTNVDRYFNGSTSQNQTSQITKRSECIFPHKKISRKTNARSSITHSLHIFTGNQSATRTMCACAYVRSAWLPNIRQGIRRCHFIHLFIYFSVRFKINFMTACSAYVDRRSSVCVMCACECVCAPAVIHPYISISSSTSKCDFLHKNYVSTIEKRKTIRLCAGPKIAFHCAMCNAWAMFDDCACFVRFILGCHRISCLFTHNDTLMAWPAWPEVCLFVVSFSAQFFI